jgi:branched-chain amino acid transport system permease protein
MRQVLYSFLGALVLASLVAPGVAHAEGEAIKGTLQYTAQDGSGRVPVEGAEIQIFAATLSEDGRSIEELGESLGVAASDDKGYFEFFLQGSGDYAAQLSIDTLPEGIALKDSNRDVLPARVVTSQEKSLLFSLVEGESRAGPSIFGDPWYKRLARLSVNGLQFGLIIGMCAIGLSMIYGTTGLVNYAHGEMITLGAVLAWMFNVTYGLSIFLAAFLATVLGAGAGLGLDRVLWRPLRRRVTGLVAMSIISIGLSIFMQYAILYQFGDRPAKYAQYSVQRKSITLGPIALSPKEIIIMGLSAGILVAVGLSLRFTRIGRAMRAVSDNPDLAASSGVDVNRTISLVWLIGGGLVSLGAVFQGLTQTVSWTMGQQLLLLTFAAVTLGGLGTSFGAMTGSVIVGIAILSSTVVWPSELQTVPALMMMIIILLVRPQGIFGRGERVG